MPSTVVNPTPASPSVHEVEANVPPVRAVRNGNCLWASDEGDRDIDAFANPPYVARRPKTAPSGAHRMIDTHFYVSILQTGPRDVTRMGDVRPGASIFGGAAARRRAP